MVPDRNRTGRRQHQEPHIVVVVGVLGRRFDPVDVQVDSRFHDPQPGDSRLLNRLTQGHPGKVGVTVGVTAGLEPALQLGVEQEEYPTIRGIHDECRASEVTGPTAPVEGISADVQQLQDRVAFRAGRAGLNCSARVAGPARRQIRLTDGESRPPR